MFARRHVRDRRARCRSCGAAMRARQAMTSDNAALALTGARAAQPPALRRLHRPHRHRACSSSASPRRRPSTASATSASRPGQSTTVKGYTFTYVKPTGPHRAARRRAGADHARLAHPRDEGRASQVAILEPSRGYYPVNGGIELGRPQPLLRGRVDERDRAARRADPRRVDRRAARHRRAAEEGQAGRRRLRPARPLGQDQDDAGRRRCAT